MNRNYFGGSLRIEWQLDQSSQQDGDCALRGFGDDGEVYFATGILYNGKIIDVIEDTIEIDC